MFSSLQIVKLFGIPVKVHWTFALLIAYVAFVAYSQGIGLPGTIMTLVLLALVFVCVVLHEYGHALTARKFGVITRDIILSPIGGIARLENIPDKPREELLIAIAGPMVNVVIAAIILGLYLIFAGELLPLLTNEFWQFDEAQPLGWLLLKINLLLIGFNIIPAFPMDGGRVARALLSIRFNRITATKIASYMGRGLAIVFIIVSLFWGNFILTIIGIFVFLAALNEYRAVLLQHTLNQYQLREVIRADFTKIYVDDYMEQPARHLMQGNEAQFLVFDHDEILKGVLIKPEIIRAIRNQALNRKVSEYISQDFEVISPETQLMDVFKMFHAADHYIFPVKDENNIIGVIDRHIISNLLELASDQSSKGGRLKILRNKPANSEKLTGAGE